MAKAPQRNPFGTEEEPAKFNEFDIFTKVYCSEVFYCIFSKLAHVYSDSRPATINSVDDGKSRSHPGEDGGTKRLRTDYLGMLICKIICQYFANRGILAN